MLHLSLGLRLDEITLLSKGIPPNTCITVGNNGTHEGYSYPLGLGSVIPTHADNGKRFGGFLWALDGSSSVIAIGFGDAQNEKLDDDVHILLVNVYGKSYSAEWNDANNAYLISNQPLVDKLILLNDGDELCMYVGAIPDTFIHYGFTADIGDKSC